MDEGIEEARLLCSVVSRRVVVQVLTSSLVVLEQLLVVFEQLLLAWEHPFGVVVASLGTSRRGLDSSSEVEVWARSTTLSTLSS